jgi:glycosyltransferase involved in cell wall biosynthesis
MPAPEVSVVIPCLNEAANAAHFAETLFGPLERTGLACEVIFSDGGSADGTPEIIEASAAGRPWVRVLKAGGKASFAQSLARALPECRAGYVVFLEADLSFSPLDIPRLLGAAREGGCDCVCGSPFLGSFDGLPPLRRLLTGGANLLLRARFGASVTSYTQIFKLYRTAALRRLRFENEGFMLDAELLAKALALGLKVAEIPVTMKGRGLGRSKLNTAAEIWSCVKLLAKGVGPGA